MSGLIFSILGYVTFGTIAFLCFRSCELSTPIAIFAGVISAALFLVMTTGIDKYIESLTNAAQNEEKLYGSVITSAEPFSNEK